MHPVLGNGENYYPVIEWQVVEPPTRNDAWFLLKRDFPHVTPSYLKLEFGLDIRLPQKSTVEQLQVVYRTLQARKLNGLLLQ